MKLTNKLTRTAFTLVAALVGVASASAIQVKMGTFDAGAGAHYRANPDSEFEYILDNYALGKSTDGEWFGTFCIEKNEYFKPGRTYDVEINDGSIRGGRAGAVNGKDTISIGTAWLYEQFALGTLTGFNYGNAKHAKQLQNSIWALEDEIGTKKKSKFGTFVDLAMSTLGLDFNGLKSDYTGKSVKVMNLTKNGKNGVSHHQDQLVYSKVPDSISSIALLGLAFAGFATLRRKKA